MDGQSMAMAAAMQAMKVCCSCFVSYMAENCLSSLMLNATCSTDVHGQLELWRKGNYWRFLSDGQSD